MRLMSFFQTVWANLVVGLAFACLWAFVCALPAANPWQTGFAGPRQSLQGNPLTPLRMITWNHWRLLFDWAFHLWLIVFAVAMAVFVGRSLYARRLRSQGGTNWALITQNSHSGLLAGMFLDGSCFFAFFFLGREIAGVPSDHIRVWVHFLALLIFSLYVVSAFASQVAAAQSSAPKFCGECGYSLTNLTSQRCPECGWSIPDFDAFEGDRTVE